MIAKRVSGACAVVLAALLGFATLSQAQPARLIDRDISEAYQYVLGRLLVLRQEALDLKEGFKWNELVHREPGGVAWANPNLDVVYSEAWIGIDENSCVLVELPEIKGRYFTVQVLNGWGEVTANINERKYPKHPFGKFALCLKGVKIPSTPRGAPLPKGTLRVDLPNKKSHVLIRIELGANPADAVALQKRITMKPFGSPVIDKAVIEPTFTNDKLPGVEIFDKVDQLFASEPDQNPGAFGVQERVRAITKALADPKERVRVDEVIRKQSIPSFLSAVQKPGTPKNNWVLPRAVGNYGTDYQARTIANFSGIWANNTGEAVYFASTNNDGNQTLYMTFPADALPKSKARYFWSITAVDGERFRVIPNALKRYSLGSQSPLKFNDGGSLTLAFAPRLPKGFPESNWLPTPERTKYNLTLRFYGPPKDLANGKYYPPALGRKP